jgi:hypothetical protein
VALGILRALALRAAMGVVRGKPVLGCDCDQCGAELPQYVRMAGVHNVRGPMRLGIPTTRWRVTMDPAVVGAVVAVLVGVALKVADWLLTRQGRQLLTRKDLREEVAQLWKRLDEQQKEIDFWKERYMKLEVSYDERERTHRIELEDLQRKYNVVLVELNALKMDSHRTGG